METVLSATSRPSRACGNGTTGSELLDAFEEGMSERELALLNEIPRVWDSGKIRFVKPHPARDNN